MTKRAVILCPGRGSYTEASLRSLPGDHPFVAAAEELRAEYELPSLLELDRAEAFKSATHLAPSNVSPLIYTVSMLDAAAAKAAHRVVATGGNSLGWYTALAVAGALSFEDGFRLVQEIALLQERHVDGGQILYPMVGDDWRADQVKINSVNAALALAPGRAFESIRLGGVIVLAGTEEGLRTLEGALPKAKVGKNTYPFRLMKHGPYHTPLLAEVAEQARESLADLDWRAPEIALVDGAGRRYAPWSRCVDALRDYTLGEQIVTPFDFTATVRAALREFAPDLVVLPGPGNTLGGVVGQCLVAEGWRGVHAKADFERVQGGEDVLVFSMQR
jgi:[acyl-carrier-protein] S-malonyltransferase